MKGKKIGYIRVSTFDQNPERQLSGIELDKTFTEYASGSTIERPALKEMLAYVRDDDTLFIHSIDRLARNLRDLLGILTDLRKNNITVIFITENLTFNADESPISKLLLQIMGAVAEFERSISLERQREGIEKARARGVYSRGRKKKLTEKDIPKIEAYIKHKWKIYDIADQLGTSAQLIYTFIKEHNIKFDKMKRNPLSEKQIALIMHMAENGFSKKEIAKELGIRMCTLYGYLRKFNIIVTKYKAR